MFQTKLLQGESIAEPPNVLRFQNTEECKVGELSKLSHYKKKLKLSVL